MLGIYQCDPADGEVDGYTSLFAQDVGSREGVGEIEEDRLDHDLDIYL